MYALLLRPEDWFQVLFGAYVCSKLRRLQPSIDEDECVRDIDTHKSDPRGTRQVRDMHQSDPTVRATKNATYAQTDPEGTGSLSDVPTHLLV